MRKLVILGVLAVVFAALGYGIWIWSQRPSIDPGPVSWTNSSEIKATQIVPSIDTPIQPGHSWIWCATFQLAWDQLCEKVNGEAINLEGGEEVAKRLNNSKFDSKHLVSRSYYVKAGISKAGIADTIRQDMARQFPSHQVPPLENGNAAIAYAYLQANLKFSIPYMPDEMQFFDSNGMKSKVRAFGFSRDRRIKGRWPGEQLEVLFGADSARRMGSFAIDLDKTSSPHQIILASIEPQESLAAAWKHVWDSMKNKEDRPREFDDLDEIMVPKMNWGINHHFSEVENKSINQGGLKGAWISTAHQSIRFGLDERGAELSSEALIKVEAIPRFFHFNRPYLIAMLKRGAAEPYFLMWVDNAELMQK
jgi:hypothetical protein